MAVTLSNNFKLTKKEQAWLSFKSVIEKFLENRYSADFESAS